MSKFHVFKMMERQIGLRRLDDLWLEYCILVEADSSCLKEAEKHRIIAPIEFRDFIKSMDSSLDDTRADLLLFVMMTHKFPMDKFDFRVCYLWAITSPRKELKF